ncbi:uncharacterized protein EV422DRAFT_618631 [Fimicolochytrium jonesii]|uniref:uncharacterized protein n=1 Tax=Fimicolochytrium jonesii TaxID=1396493 RepID=UPI0022FE5DE8|nr:uncharacterized protein EV422DRAFT_618631 [Fimicolochytrium jonesii]KAI8822901.1 hypothetical protein EV422DRAFT_618631 [Fimicolochytrium jonesii]
MISNAGGDEGPLLGALESEHLVASLKKHSLQDVGSPEWMKHHDIVEKLNIQAHWNTLRMCEEFVGVQIVDEQKMEAVVYDLILIDTWKRLVWNKIKKKKIHPENTLRVYFILYHESTVVNLLEILLYNQTACESLGDAIVDLIDYCARKISELSVSDHDAELSDESNKERGERQSASNLLDNPSQQLRTHLSSLSVLRHITTHLSALPYSVMTRILGKHDLIVALAWVMEKKPWERRRRVGKKWVVERFGENGDWAAISEEEKMGVAPWEAQVLLTLYTLLLDGECRSKYEFNPTNHAIILKLRQHITPTILDQLPPLASLLRYLEELSLFTPPNGGVAKPLMGFVEEVPKLEGEILDNVDLNTVRAKAADMLKTAGNERDIAQSLAETYTHPTLSTLLPDTPKCANPGCPNRSTHPTATQRCSRCKSEWYCSRPCQVENWKVHKTVCDMLKAEQ